MKEKYYLLTGDKHDFERELNELIEQGWATFGNMCAVNNVDSIEYSMLMLYPLKRAIE